MHATEPENRRSTWQRLAHLPRVISIALMGIAMFLRPGVTDAASRFEGAGLYGSAAQTQEGDAAASREMTDPPTTVALIRELASATGWQGMIGGEAADIEGERQPPDAARVARIHAAKTATTCLGSFFLGIFRSSSL